MRLSAKPAQGIALSAGLYLAAAAIGPGGAAETLPAPLLSCQQAGDPKTRIEACSAAIAGGALAGDQLALAFGLRAHALAASGDAKGALADVEAGLRLSPDALDLLYERGMAHLALEDYKAAREDFSAILKIAPDDFDSRYQRAWALAQLGEDEAAIADLGAVLKAKPKDVDTLMDRGGLLLRSGRWPAAVADFAAILAIDPKASAAAYNRGRAYALMGDFAAAAKDFARARQSRGDNPYASLRLYLAELHQGQDDRAMLAETYAAGSPDQWPLPLIAVFLGKAGEDDLWLALNLKDAGLARQFKIEAGFYLGEWARAKGDIARAKTRLQRAALPLARDIMESTDAAAILAQLK